MDKPCSGNTIREWREFGVLVVLGMAHELHPQQKKGPQ